MSDLSIVVDLADDTVAYPVEMVRPVGIVNDRVSGVALAVGFDPSDEHRWSVFSRVLDDAVVDLAVDGDRYVDTISGSHFDPRLGRAIDGPLQGQVLDRLPGFTALPRDFDRFWPDGRVWEP